MLLKCFYDQLFRLKKKTTVSYNTRLLVFEMNQFFLSPRKKIGTSKRFCLARMPLTRISIARVVVVKIFTAPKNISSYFCFALYFRVQRCPACHGMRQTRRKNFSPRRKRASVFLKTTSKPPRQVSIYCPLKHIF